MSEIHVVAVVGNDIINDNRVKKAAASSAAAGYRTTLVCYAPETSRRASPMGAVEVVRVPVPFHVRDRFRRVPGLARNFDGTEINQRHLAPRIPGKGAPAACRTAPEGRQAQVPDRHRVAQ